MTLIDTPSPFICHEFLSALENQRCVGDHYGWIPLHAALYDDASHIIGAVPMYLKFNSYGEFVFDWMWEHAYQRNGIEYYPKLVVSSPYSPVPGPRILISPAYRQSVGHTFIAHIIEYARKINVSSLHSLFTQEQDNEIFCKNDFEIRYGYQFHWFNQNYRDFDHYLGTLKNRKRKNIKQERKKVHDAKMKIRVLHGTEISDKTWGIYHRHYCSTFERLGGHPTLSLGFFQEIAQTLGDQVILFAAFDGDTHVASAFCLRDQYALYGRHWGCDQSYDGLHFEACYYQGIDYCIDHKLSRFEPGAQGEHKISRGFLPTATYSAHWISLPEFRQPIYAGLRQEKIDIEQYMETLSQSSPFKTTNEIDKP